VKLINFVKSLFSDCILIPLLSFALGRNLYMFSGNKVASSNYFIVMICPKIRYIIPYDVCFPPHKVFLTFLKLDFTIRLREA